MTSDRDLQPFVSHERLWPPLAEPEFTLQVRRYVRERVVPQAEEIDANDIYPVELAKDMAKQGMSSCMLPAEYGGGGRDFAYALALFEEVAVGSAALAVLLLTTFQAQTIIRLFGSEGLQKLADRCRPLGWHLDLGLNSQRLMQLAPTLAALDVLLVIDHLGFCPLDYGVNHPEFAAILDLMRLDRC
jgi:hypothetical protein